MKTKELKDDKSERKREVIKSVEARPEKNFFVNMLTRDIELKDAVLDLLDNCVDGALRTLAKGGKPSTSLAGFWAKITLSGKKFTIEDNCGGIPWVIAKEYAFKMGKPESSEKPEGTIGVVGIGMKRAIFKMGRKCYVHSDHEDDAFMVSIEPEWFGSNEWDDFPAEREKGKSSGHGTIIEIENLTDDTEVAFAEGSSFRQSFPLAVGEAYSYLIEKGFKITIDKETIKAKPVRLCFEEKVSKRLDGLIRPFVYAWQYQGVDVFFAVGYRSRFKTEDELKNESDESYAAADAGWTVLCNDRVVLSNDRTVKTGWEHGGVPRFHNQFSCIAGIVEFHARDTKMLPITTTKRGIDPGKEVYLLTLQKMQEATKHFTKNTNKWKGYEQELKARFEQAALYGLGQLKDATKKLEMRAIPGREHCKQYRPDLPVKTEISTLKRISFVKPISDIEKVSLHLFDELRGTETIGEACFDKVLKEAQRK